MRAVVSIVLALSWAVAAADDPKPAPDTQTKAWTADSTKVTAGSSTATADGGTKPVKTWTTDSTKATVDGAAKPKTWAADSTKVTADSTKATADGGTKPAKKHHTAKKHKAAAKVTGSDGRGVTDDKGQPITTDQPAKH
ncbi:MAG: hypothetical protein WBF89_12425 [Steroidobacteraceae bacterium]|jgi:hypothetical protein